MQTMFSLRILRDLDLINVFIVRESQSRLPSFKYISKEKNISTFC